MCCSANEFSDRQYHLLPGEKPKTFHHRVELNTICQDKKPFVASPAVWEKNLTEIEGMRSPWLYQPIAKVGGQLKLAKPTQA